MAQVADDRRPAIGLHHYMSIEFVSDASCFLSSRFLALYIEIGRNRQSFLPAVQRPMVIANDLSLNFLKTRYSPSRALPHAEIKSSVGGLPCPGSDKNL